MMANYLTFRSLFAWLTVLGLTRLTEANFTMDLLSNMNTNATACHNFYEFACGNYKPTDRKINTIYKLMCKEIDKQLLDILVEERPQTDPKHYRLPGLMYKACTTAGVGDYIKNILKSVGDWPVIIGHSWDINGTWSWQETVKKLRRSGFNYNMFIRAYVRYNLRTRGQNIIHLDQPLTDISRAGLVTAFDFHMQTNRIEPNSRANKLSELEEAIRLKEYLENITVPVYKTDSESCDILYSIKQLQEYYPYVEWLNYINSVLPEGLTVDENDLVNVVVPEYFQNLGAVLKQFTKRTIANYMLWIVHYQIFDVMQNYNSDSKNRTCYDIVANSPHFSVILNQLYTRKHFDQNTKRTIFEMIDILRETFRQMITNSQWLPHNSKVEAKSKLDSLSFNVDYSDADKKIEKHFSKLDIDAKDFYKSLLNIYAFEEDNSFNILKSPPIKFIANERIRLANAFYMRKTNSIIMPASALQTQLFDSKKPMYMNFGASGSFIAHELVHSFTTQTYDANGNKFRWFQPDANNTFLNMTECIIQQYNNFTDKELGIHPNGRKTKTEDMADILGAQIAYIAYNRWVAKYGEESKLDGLNYTPRQMFWISNAQRWCAKQDREERRNMYSTTHSIFELRVLGPVTNSKDFSLDFKCNVDEPMNPSHKCEIF